METQTSHFNRNFLILLIILYLLSIAAFIYANWIAGPDSMELWQVLLNLPILSIPFVLLFGSLYILVVAWREQVVLGQINPRLTKIVHWAPRIAAILIIFFASLFSLDVFETQASPLELLGGFLVHNIPSIGMLVLLTVAWKRPAVGFIAFLIAAILFAAVFVRDIYALPNLLLFVLPILLVAFLFYIDWKWLARQ